MNKYKIAFVTGVPNWHFPEFYKKLTSNPRIDLTMLFCEAFSEDFNRQLFGISDMQYGVDFLEGYKYKFLRNYSPLKPKYAKVSFFRHLNFGVWKEITGRHYDAVIIDIWNGISYWLAAAASKVSGTPLLLTNDSSILKEMDKAKWKREVKKFFLTKFLFPLASGFLYRTEVNFQLFRFYGVPERLLFFYPLSVDFEGLYRKYSNLKEEKFDLRLKYKIPKDAFLILFVGRLAKEKRPQDLLEAYLRLSIPNKALIFVGDGELKNLLQENVKQKDIKNVYFMGFRPKTEIPNFYAMADLLVLPSEIESHGDVVKEAMCFALPVIVSDKVGSSLDVVKHGKNGYTYKCGDIDMLSFYIVELLDEGKRENFGRMALEEAKNWDHNVAINGLLYALDCVVKNKKER